MRMRPAGLLLGILWVGCYCGVLWGRELISMEEAVLDDGVEEPNWEDLSERLRSEEFEVRRKATDELWRLGEAGMRWVEELGENVDPELRVRTDLVRRKVEIGITPETPQEIVALIEKYLRSDTQVKKQIVGELLRGKHYDYVLKLQDGERNTEMQEHLSMLMQRYLPGLLLEAWEEENLERLETLLESGDSFEVALKRAVYLDYQGKLDEEIMRLRRMAGEQNRQRYLACLRVKGDLPFLLTESRRLQDPAGERIALILLGQVEPVLEDQLQEKELGASEQLYLQWAVANLKGDGEVAERVVQRLMRLSSDEAESERARGNLYRTSAFHRVPQTFTEDTDYRVRLAHLELQHEIVKIPEVLGLPPGELDLEWLKRQKDQLLVELDQEGLRRTRDRLLLAVEFYQAREEQESARAILEMFFDALREIPAHDLVSWMAQDQNHLLLWSEAGCQALAREVQEFEAPLELVVKELFRNSDVVQSGDIDWLLTELVKEEEEIRPELALRLVLSFVWRLVVEEETFEQWNQKLKKRVAAEYLENQDDLGLRILANIYNQVGRGEEALELLLLRGEPANASELDEVSRRGTLAAYLWQWKEAQVSFEHYLATKEEPVVRLGMVLVQNALGQSAEALKMERETLLRIAFRNRGASWGPRVWANHQRNFGRPAEAYFLLQQALLRAGNSAWINTPAAFEPVAGLALGLEDWTVAKSCYEIATFTGGTDYQSRSAHWRFHANLSRAMELLRDGSRAEAIELLKETHAMLPGSGLLADFFFPSLRQVGLTKLHDEFVHDSLNRARMTIVAYPRDANARNVFGWIASRACRSLEEAETHMRLATALKPFYEAYLDTMAEVCFAQRKREEAVAWSERSLKQKLFETQLREQNLRFKKGRFPVP